MFYPIINQIITIDNYNVILLICHDHLTFLSDKNHDKHILGYYAVTFKNPPFVLVTCIIFPAVRYIICVFVVVDWNMIFYISVASNWICSWQWPYTYDLPAPTSEVLRSQIGTTNQLSVVLGIKTRASC